MKSKKITTTVTLIWLVAFVSGAALADNENAPLAGKSPLMPNYFPAKGMIISDTGYSQIETKIDFISSSSKNTLSNLTQRLRYGITDKTEMSLSQSYVISSENHDSIFGKYYFEIGDFDNPIFGLEHRLGISDSKKIYAIGLNVRPEVSYSEYAKYSKEQIIFGKFDWQFDEDFWLSISGKYTSSYTKFFDTTTENVEVQFGTSKNWENSSAFLGFNLSQALDFSAKKFNRPNFMDRYESNLSPKIIGG
jgi:hypothetical protein